MRVLFMGITLAAACVYPGLPPQPQIAGRPHVHHAMSHEEELVRLAYAKLSYAAQIGLLWHAVAHHPGWPKVEEGLNLDRAMHEELRFDVSGVEVGNLSELQDKPWVSLVEGPVNAIRADYHSTPVRFANAHSKKEFGIIYADVWWNSSPSQHIDASRSTSKDPTVGEVLRNLRQPAHGEWRRYATYSVVASLRNRSISYRATFLFGDHDNEVLPLDYAVPQGLAEFLTSPMYPAVLLETAFREVPFVQGWIASNQITGCKKRSAPEICCDPVSGQCGLAAEDVQKSFSVPVDPNTRWLINRSQGQQKRGEIQ